MTPRKRAEAALRPFLNALRAWPNTALADNATFAVEMAIVAAEREARLRAIEKSAQIADERSKWATAQIQGRATSQTDREGAIAFGSYGNACDDCAELIRALAEKEASRGDAG